MTLGVLSLEGVIKERTWKILNGHRKPFLDKFNWYETVIKKIQLKNTKVLKISIGGFAMIFLHHLERWIN